MTNLGATVSLVNTYIMAGSAGYSIKGAKGASIALWVASVLLSIIFYVANGSQ